MKNGTHTTDADRQPEGSADAYRDMVQFIAAIATIDDADIAGRGRGSGRDGRL